MECFLPRTAFDNDRLSDVDECGDSTKCVDSNNLNSSCGSICDVSTPICNDDDHKATDYGNKISSVTTNCTDLKKIENSSGSSEARTDVVDVGCKSPSMSFTDRLKRLKSSGNSFALDDSLSNVSIIDGELAACMDPIGSMECFDTDSRSPQTCTPIKSAMSSSKSLEALNSIHTHLDEPHVNISDDETKNPVLANSIRRISKTDIAGPSEVLGTSRCWTDRFENEISDDSVSVTQSPVRSLSSMINSSQADVSDSSLRRFSNAPSYSPDFTPIRSYTSSISRVPDHLYSSEHFDSFESTSVSDMCKMSVNPMCNVSLPKEQVCRVRLSDMLEMLYKHFKNMCTVMRRSSMRNDKPYFRVIQILVQRMSRRSFTMDNLLQMAWLAPNLVGFKWVLINDSVLKKYASEYKDSSGKVYDLSIKILRPDLVNCSSSQDYEVSCFRFKTILCCWTLKCDSDGFDNFRVPLAKLPPKGARSNSSTPVRFDNSQSTPRRLDSKLTPMRLDDSQGTPRRPYATTPARLNVSHPTPTRSYVSQPTPTRSYVSQSAQMNIDDKTPRRIVDRSQSSSDKTPVRSILRSAMYDFMETTPTKSYRIAGPCSVTHSSKRLKTMDTMSPISVDLLETPGMRRIRENAKRLEIEKKTNMERDKDLKLWIDMRWFTNILLEIIVGDTSPNFKIEFLVDFIKKYGTRKVTQDQVSQWIDVLSEIDPCIISKSVSKLEDSTVITINKSASLDNAVDHINQQIKTLKSF